MCRQSRRISTETEFLAIRKQAVVHLEEFVSVFPLCICLCRVDVRETLLLCLFFLGDLQLFEDVGRAVFGERFLEELDSVVVISETDVRGTDATDSPVFQET